MHASTDTTAPAPEGRNLQTPVYGIHAPGMLAHADRGSARALAQHTEDQDHQPGGEDTRR
ncbi:hypothetical protein PV411_33950 [Streptomyces sp. NRRL_B-16638]|jgi:hypothetical protein|uniref:Uncharacterized protein n=2 Tax=Streptomyces coelicolor TaxID=1902 RepID=Q9ACW0_STRCO|nr:hypothetical protein [Streptomyces sp. NRRL_B-16638]AGO88653.1 hypothetical protein [Streptomyces coelicolor]MDX2929509.1 hypothetical protein [Streptomyces sp. NRRL_B-16638]CAC36713.1 hypothetical protein [Streptomyces coelicolor A3(2)]